MASIIVVGNESSQLGPVIATSLGAQYHSFRVEHFADSETRLAGLDCQSITGNVVLIVFQFPRIFKGDNFIADINHNLFIFLLLVQTMQAMKAQKIIVLMPYLPYSRQEKAHLDGVKPTVSLIGQIFKNVGVDFLIVSDIHSVAVRELIPIPFYALGLEVFWVEFLQKQIVQQYQWADVCIVAPDHGASQRLKDVTSRLGLKLVKMTKQRISPDNCKTLSIEGAVKNKIVIIIDDIVDTALTAVNSCNVLREHGALQVIGCFSHAILSSGAVERLDASGFDKVYIADTLFFDSATLSSKFCVISVNDFLTNALVAVLQKASN